MTKAKKICLLVSIVLIIAGAIMYATIGFNYGLSYGDSKRIVISMKDNFEVKDYKNIAKEVFGVSKVETTSTFNDGVSIKVKSASDEQLDNLVTKINEKYGYEYTRDDLTVTDVSKVAVFDIIKQEIIPILTTLLIILVYMVIRYKKQGLVKVILNLFVPAILGQLVVLSIYAIGRIPVTNVLLPVELTTYIITVFYSTKQLEK